MRGCGGARTSGLSRGARLLRGARIAFRVAMVCFAGGAAQAQDIDSEIPIKEEVAFKHVWGVGPQLQQCFLTEKGSLKCASDEKLEHVDCMALKGQNPVPLRSRGSGAAFLCDKTPGEVSGLFNYKWQVTLVGADGGVSQWEVTGATIQQQESAFHSELVADAQPAPPFSRYEIASTSSLRFGTVTDIFTGAWAQGRVARSTRFLGAVDFWGRYEMALSSNTARTSLSDYEIGLTAYPVMGPRWGLGASLGVGQMARSGYPNFEHSAAFNYYHDLGERFVAESAFKAVWPDVRQLRQSLRARASIGVYLFKKRILLRGAADYITEQWIDSARFFEKHLKPGYFFDGVELRVTISWVGPKDAS